jgi:hypothetical protein
LVSHCEPLGVLEVGPVCCGTALPEKSNRCCAKDCRATSGGTGQRRSWGVCVVGGAAIVAKNRARRLLPAVQSMRAGSAVFAPMSRVLVAVAMMLVFTPGSQTLCTPTLLLRGAPLSEVSSMRTKAGFKSTTFCNSDAASSVPHRDDGSGVNRRSALLKGLAGACLPAYLQEKLRRREPIGLREPASIADDEVLASRPLLTQPHTDSPGALDTPRPPTRVRRRQPALCSLWG